MKKLSLAFILLAFLAPLALQATVLEHPISISAYELDDSGAVAAGNVAEAPIRKLFLEEVNLGEIDWSSWQQLEKAVREYHDAVPFNQRTYVGLVDGIPYNGIADNVVKIDGIDIAIEAKYCKDWSKSLRNPASSIGTKPFAIAEQEKMILQARKYSDAFKNGKIRYYTNSRELAEYYTDQFKKYNLANIEFIIVK